ncbi:hypothetical protein E8E13_010020 [Curvularia kusanoi]|uniref:Uncharacterized protein n=1 Tax=Curvularia kusanoi TaxID=90978 RepID=A0A9P4TLD3_CURKU|nr:hypothetical protein E8E13_010020 [Curvularia kusanoi]
MPYRRRLDQGPEPSAADIYPDDALWAAQQPQAASSDQYNAAQPAEQVEVPTSTTPQLSFEEMRAKLDAINAGNPPIIRWPAKERKEPTGTPGGCIILPGLGVRSLDGRPLPGPVLAGNTSTASQRAPPRGQPPKPDPSSHDASTSISLASLRSLNADNPPQPIQRRSKAEVDAIFKSAKPGERLHLFGPKQSGPPRAPGSRFGIDWSTLPRSTKTAPETAPTSSDERALSPAQQDGSRYGIQTGIGHGADWKGMQAPNGSRDPFASDKKTFAPDKNAFYSADEKYSSASKKQSAADKKQSSPDKKPSFPDEKSSSPGKKQFSPGKKQ